MTVKSYFPRPEIYSLNFRLEWSHLIGVFIFLFGCYYYTTPRTIALEDDGLFVLSSYFAGIAHPPGYPLHTILGHLFTYLPIGSIAFRVHLLSAFFGAATCVVLWWNIRLFVPGRAPAYAGALCYGLSKTFWSQSIIAEIYTLNTFFFFLIFTLCILLVSTKKPAEKTSDTDHVNSYSKNKLLLWISFLYGLSLTVHWPLILLSTPAFIFVIFYEYKLILKSLHKLIPVFLIALTPYIWMALNSSKENVLMVYATPSLLEWENFKIFVSREVYSEVDTSSTATILDKLQFIGFFIQETLSQYFTPLIAFALFGVFVQRKYFSSVISCSMILAFLGNSILLIILLGFDYDLVHQMVFRVYPLIAYGILSIWLAIGIYWISSRYSVKSSLLSARIMTIFTICTVIIFNFPQNDRSDYKWADNYAKYVLNALDQNSALLIDADTDVGPIGYLHYVENYRADIKLISHLNSVRPYTLFYPRKPLFTDSFNNVQELAGNLKNSFYFLDKVEHGFGNTFHWPHTQVNTELAPSNINFEMNQNAIAYLEYVTKQIEQNDIMTELHVRQLLLRALPYLIKVRQDNKHKHIQEKLNHYIDIASQSFEGKIILIDEILNQNIEVEQKYLVQLLKSAEMIIDEAMYKSSKPSLQRLRKQVKLKYTDN
jgi:hypothetical protein